MNAMILAAGRGTRLGALGRKVPKILVDVGGVPLLQHQLLYLERQGVQKVVVNGHHLVAAVETYIADYRGGVEVALVHEEHLLGTAGGVRNALDLLGEAPFLVLYGDVLVEQDVTEMMRWHMEHLPACTLAVYESEDVEGKGTVEVDDLDEVVAFVEKGSEVSVPALVNAGVYVVSHGLIANLPARVDLDFGHDVFPAALRSGRTLAAHRLRRPVIDVGTPVDLERARRLARERSQLS